MWSDDNISRRLVDIIAKLKAKFDAPSVVKSRKMSKEAKLFEFLKLFIQGENRSADAVVDDNLDVFALVKDRTYQRCESKEELVKLLRPTPPETSRVLLGYIIHEHPLLQKGWEQKPYKELLTPCRNYLIKKFNKVSQPAAESGPRLKRQRISGLVYPSDEASTSYPGDE